MTPDHTTTDVVVEYLRASFPTGEVDSEKDVGTGGCIFTACDAGKVYVLSVSMECLADIKPAQLATRLNQWDVAAELMRLTRIRLSRSGPHAA